MNGAARTITSRSRLATTVALASLVVVASVVLGLRSPDAGAQGPAAPPIGEYVHDLYDQRYRPPAERGGPRTPGSAAPAAPVGGQTLHGAGHQQYHVPPGTPGQTSAAHDHGTPPGWRFTLPQGDPEKGRAVFVKLECYACHAVKGQTFPGVTDGAHVGPELSEMAAHHEREFFAEAIVNPNAVIDEPQWRAPDGTSRMPSFNDSITVQELVDLVAFLKSLTPPVAATDHKH